MVLKLLLTHFFLILHPPYTLETSGNLWFSDFFGGFGNAISGRDGLNYDSCMVSKYLAKATF